MAKHVDLFVDPCDINVLYNNFKVDMLPKQKLSESWQGAQDYILSYLYANPFVDMFTTRITYPWPYCGHMFDFHLPLNNKHVIINVSILIFSF